MLDQSKDYKGILANVYVADRTPNLHDRYGFDDLYKDNIIHAEMHV
jgi:hypothetical protein